MMWSAPKQHVQVSAQRAGEGNTHTRVSKKQMLRPMLAVSLTGMPEAKLTERREDAENMLSTTRKQ